jgi:hypothetical protein
MCEHVFDIRLILLVVIKINEGLMDEACRKLGEAKNI